ncbi:hypothetical protein ABZ867_11925 [Streptomyces cinnamoneus]
MIVPNGVHIAGYQALLIAFVIQDYRKRSSGLDRIHPDELTALLATVADLEHVGKQWQQGKLGNTNSQVQATGGYPAIEADKIGKTISVREAAEILGLSSRQTRNIAHRLGGRIVRGEWRLDTAAVAAEHERRREARG